MAFHKGHKELIDLCPLRFLCACCVKKNVYKFDDCLIYYCYFCSKF